MDRSKGLIVFMSERSRTAELAPVQTAEMGGPSADWVGGSPRTRPPSPLRYP